MKKHIIKLLITGGHLTPAIATIEELKQRNITVDIVFIGRNTATEQYADKSYEREAAEKAGVRFYPLVTGRLQRHFSVQSFLSLLKIPIGFFQALFYITKERPDCIISFGGYLALPVVVLGWLFRVPSITHEQTSVAGLANSIIARFAKKICITFPDTIHNFPPEKIVYTGLPLGSHFIRLREHMDERKTDSAILYITGGSTGSESINTVIFDSILELTRGYTLIHQTGRVSYQKAQEIRSMLSPLMQKRYFIQPYFTGEEVEQIYAKARLIIGRSGANTVIELATIGKIAVLIPLPWSGGGEQMKNAQWMEAQGGAIVISQSKFSKESLLNAIEYIDKQTDQFQKKAEKLKKTMPVDGAKRFVDEIIAII